MKCVKCEREATFDSPESLCDEHWAEWWAFNQPDDEVQLTQEEQEEYKREVLEEMGD